jgi:hypothetical protein
MTDILKTSRLVIFMLTCLIVAPASAQSTAFPASILAENPTSIEFQLVTKQNHAIILIDDQDYPTVKLCTGLFRDDVERVTGYKPALINSQTGTIPYCLIIGSIEQSRIIKKLISSGKIDVSAVQGQWESCLTQTVDNPLPGIAKALVIAGSDRRGTAYGIFELSRQIGVSPWYFFADVPPVRRAELSVKAGTWILKSPSVKYRGIFINDEMWGLRPWALHTFAPREGLGIGPTTYSKIFELLLRLKANLLWPAMHQQTRPFNLYEQNKVVADQYAIIMGSSHIEPMLRNNIAGAEWDTEYPGEPWDYVKNKDHIYKYWEDRVKANGRYDNMYTLGKRGKDDEAGTDITVPVLERIFTDQRSILRKWVNKDVSKVPQVLIAYTEVLELYNQGLKVPDDVTICWPDDNFGNIRQLPNANEQLRSGGSGIYYHFQWLNGATTAYTWTCTTPLALTWSEMKKAYDYGAKKLWVVNVGDIKPAEMNIEYFMQMAWDISVWDHQNSDEFVTRWATREFGIQQATAISDIMRKHYELGYARRPESMVLWNGRENRLNWEWFSMTDYDDEAQGRMDEYAKLIKQVDKIYESLPIDKKDAFFEMVVYNVKGTALQNIKVLNAQKSNVYGGQKRSSAATYAAKAQEAENEINRMIHHYNRELVTAGSKWDRMASLPGPWGGQWRQWDMPPLSFYSGEGEPAMQAVAEGGDTANLPGFSIYNQDRGFIDLYNTGTGVIYWSSNVSDEWITLSETSGVLSDEKRIWVSIDWEKAPKGITGKGKVTFRWTSSAENEWSDYDQFSEKQKEAFRKGDITFISPGRSREFNLAVFNPTSPAPGEVMGFVESNGYISIEAEHFSRKTDGNGAAWTVIEGLGRTGNSVAVLPPTVASIISPDEIAASSPVLEYDLYTFTTGKTTLQLNCIPSYPIHSGYGLRVAVSIDDNKPQLVEFKNGSRNVMDNLLTLNTELNFDTTGKHVLKIRMVDPGVVIDKLIINTGGVKRSYLGPPESFSSRK